MSTAPSTTPRVYDPNREHYIVILRRPDGTVRQAGCFAENTPTCYELVGNQYFWARADGTLTHRLEQVDADLAFRFTAAEAAAAFQSSIFDFCGPLTRDGYTRCQDERHPVSPWLMAHWKKRLTGNHDGAWADEIVAAVEDQGAVVTPGDLYFLLSRRIEARNEAMTALYALGALCELAPALLELRDPDVAGEILASLKSTSPSIQEAAVEAIWYCGPKMGGYDVKAALTAMIQGPEGGGRHAAAYLLQAWEGKW